MSDKFIKIGNSIFNTGEILSIRETTHKVEIEKPCAAVILKNGDRIMVRLPEDKPLDDYVNLDVINNRD